MGFEALLRNVATVEWLGEVESIKGGTVALASGTQSIGKLGGGWLDSIYGGTVEVSNLPSALTSLGNLKVSLEEIAITPGVDIQAQYRKLHCVSTTALATSASYTSTSEDTLDRFSRITGSVFADQPGTLYIEQSPDNSNWDVSESIAVDAGAGQGFSKELVARYVRVRYVNGATAQSTFRLYAWLRVLP